MCYFFFRKDLRQVNKNDCVLKLTTSEFVAAIVAVQYTVAFVRFLYALSEISAFELRRRTGDRRTAFFVLIVETVVVAVAHPGLGNAVAGPRASEL